MQEAIDKLLSSNSNHAFTHLKATDLEYFGVVKLLEIIGEAAYKITLQFKVSHPETPWKYIVGMRHILVHGYYQVNKADVIKTIEEDLPVLRDQIARYLTEFE